MADKTASYALNLEGNLKQSATDDAAALEKLKASVAASMAGVKEYGAALRALRGSTDEVKAAKDQLRAKVEAARSAVSAGTLELLKQGTTYERLADQTKKAAAEQKRYQDNLKQEQIKRLTEEQKKLGESLRAAGGPVSEFRDKLEKLDTSLSTSGGALALMGTAAIAAAVIVVDLASKVADLGFQLGKWIIGSADAARNAGLLREAWTGNAKDASHLGNQINALAAKVPTAREELNKLGVGLVRDFRGSYVGGQGLVDLLNAIGQTAASVGDEAGGKIRSIFDAAKNAGGRIAINPLQLQGTGLDFKALATKLAGGMHTSVEAAAAALRTGRVKIGDAAAAVRAAVEDRFGGINARKLLSLDSVMQKFKDNLAGLTTGVNLQPMLESLSKVAGLFDANTASGAALKTIITAIGNTITSAFAAVGPKIKEPFELAELVVIKTMIAVKGIDLQLQKTFGADYKSKILSWGFTNLENELKGAADLVERFGNRISTGIAVIRIYGQATSQVFGQLKDFVSGFVDLGSRIIEGLVKGIRGSIGAVVDEVTKVADRVKKGFTGALGINSPSKVFEQYGKHTTEGYQQGVEKGTSATQRVVERMVVEPKPASTSAAAPARGGAGGRAAPVNLTVNINAGAGGAQELSSPQFLQQLTKAILDTLAGAGMPIQTEPST